MTTAPPNGIGFTVFATEAAIEAGFRVAVMQWEDAHPESAIVHEVRELVSRAWAQARRCEDCGAESGESCRWPCLDRPEGS